MMILTKITLTICLFLAFSANSAKATSCSDYPAASCPGGACSNSQVCVVKKTFADGTQTCTCAAAPAAAPLDKTGTLRLTMPELQISIPGLDKFSEAKACTSDNKKLCIGWLNEYIAALYRYGIGIVGILATIIMMWGGVIWLTSAGNASKITEAKAWITSALTGLVVALSSYMILYQINPNLVWLKGLEITKIADKAIELGFTSGGGTGGGTGNITTNITTFDNALKSAAAANGLDCTMLKAVMFAESTGNPNAVSPRGAQGLMQLMPDTFSAVCGTNCNALNATHSINAAAKYMRDLKSEACNGKSSSSVCNSSDKTYFIAAYNGGPKANKESTNCPGKTGWQCEKGETPGKGYGETRGYVPKVNNNYQKLKDKGWGC